MHLNLLQVEYRYASYLRKCYHSRLEGKIGGESGELGSATMLDNNGENRQRTTDGNPHFLEGRPMAGDDT
jgi:hypothetical protein